MRANRWMNPLPESGEQAKRSSAHSSTRARPTTAEGRCAPRYPRGVSYEYAKAPIDALSAERLAAQGLDFALVDTSDREALTTWLQVENRGFHGGRLSQAKLDAQLPHIAHRRTAGVWDPDSADAASPVATVSAWVMDLTVPGETSIPAWAVTAVSVSPTHRRRGIARALLEAELRTAASLDVPVAILTVTEATIYGRYGFGPSVMSADWTIDTTRARWIGPETSGSLSFVEPETMLQAGYDLVQRVRLQTPGQVEFADILWERLLGADGDPESAKSLRVVRFDDNEGELQGFAAYRVVEMGDDFTNHRLNLVFLVSATDEAYAGLWRFLLEMDLVSSISAPLRAIDEPLLWQLSDQRAVRRDGVREHLWTRILNVPVALSARSYSAPGVFVLDVSDGLGFADGLFLLTVAADGSASVELLEGEAPDGAAAIALTVDDLGTLYLGGVSAITLARAGRITELRPGSAISLEASFRSLVTPWLSVWF
jgi:predicted acetyltransferase